MRARALASIILGCIASVSPVHAAFEYRDRLDLPVTGYNGPNDWFGTNIEAANGSVLVSAQHDTWPGAHESGSLYSFVRRGGTWEVEDIVRPEPGACRFGERLVADGGVAYAAVHPCGIDPSAEPLANGQRSWVQRLRTSGDGRWASEGLLPGGGDFPPAQDVLRFDAHGGTFAALIGERDVAESWRVYVLDAATGQHAVIDPDTLDIELLRGVSVSGDRMALAYGGGDVPPTVAFLERSGGTWHVVDTVLDPDHAGSPFDSEYGKTLLLRGDDLFVGAIHAGRVGHQPGAVHHHRRASDGRWPLVERLAPPDGRHLELFGANLIWNPAGGELVVVAPGRHGTPLTPHQGALYRYCLTGQWTPCGYADAITPDPDDYDNAPTGGDAAFAAGDLLFGTPMTINPDGTQGLVSIRHRDPALSIAGTFDPGYGGHDASFGRQIAARDGHAAVLSDTGVDVYAQQASGWEHDATLTIPPLDAETPCMARSVAMGNGYVVADRVTRRHGTHVGLVVFRRTGAGWTTQTIDLPPDETPLSTYGQLVVSGDRVYYARWYAPGMMSSTARVLVFDPSTSAWDATLTLPQDTRVPTGPRVQGDDRRLVVATNAQVYVYATAPGGARQLQAALPLPPQPTSYIGLGPAFAASAAFGERSIFLSEQNVQCPGETGPQLGVIRELRRNGDGWEYGDVLCVPRLVPARLGFDSIFTLAQSNGALLISYLTGDGVAVTELQRRGGGWQPVSTLRPAAHAYGSTPHSLLASGRTLLIGVEREPHVDTAAPTGAVFAFERSDVFAGDFEPAE